MTTDQATIAERTTGARRGRTNGTVDLAAAERDIAAAEAALRRAGRWNTRAEIARNAAQWGVAELAALATGGQVVADAA
jgi:hypothetical protein